MANVTFEVPVNSVIFVDEQEFLASNIVDFVGVPNGESTLNISSDGRGRLTVSSPSTDGMHMNVSIAGIMSNSDGPEVQLVKIRLRPKDNKIYCNDNWLLFNDTIQNRVLTAQTRREPFARSELLHIRVLFDKTNFWFTEGNTVAMKPPFAVNEKVGLVFTPEQLLDVQFHSQELYTELNETVHTALEAYNLDMDRARNADNVVHEADLDDDAFYRAIFD